MFDMPDEFYNFMIVLMDGTKRIIARANQSRGRGVISGNYLMSLDAQQHF